MSEYLKGVAQEIMLGDLYEGESTWAGTIGNVGMGFVPIVGQVADFRDTVAAGKEVLDDPFSGAAWGGLGLAALAWVPGLDFLKGAKKVQSKMKVRGGKVRPKAKPKAKPKKAAPGFGERYIKEEERLGINADLAVQQHKQKTNYRKGSGREIESAHMVNSSSLKELKHYKARDALTVLMPLHLHREFDNNWKRRAREIIKERAKKRGGKLTPEDAYIRVDEWERILVEAAEQVPGLKGRAADTMAFIIRTELYQNLSLNPGDLIRIPFSKK
ncbi:MAG: hypothetical protein AAFZ15_31930 [Bacteroidota bacterium]